jgi:hypothetical protein
MKDVPKERKSTRSPARRNNCGENNSSEIPAVTPNRTGRLLSLTLTAMLFSPAGLPAQGVEYVKDHYTKYEYRIPMRAVTVGASDKSIYVWDCLNHRVVRVDKQVRRGGGAEGACEVIFNFAFMDREP